MTENNFDRKTGLLFSGLLAALLAFHYVPMLVSAYYNLPTSVDDYCYADTVKEFGMWEAQHMYFTQVSGRYISTFLQHVFNSLSYDSHIGYKILPIVSLAAMVAAVNVVFRHFFEAAKTSLLVSLVFVSVFIAQLPSLAEGLYWFSSLMVHWLGLILFFVNCGFLLAAMNASIRRKMTVFWAVTFVVISAGASEPTFLSFVMLCFATVAYQLCTTKKVSKEVAVITVAGVVGALLIKFSVANMGKQNKSFSDLTPDLFLQVAKEVLLFCKDFFSWYLLVALLLYVVFFGNKIKVMRLFNLPIWYVAIIIAGILYFNHLVGVVGIGGSAPRIQNVIYLFFLTGLLFFVSTIWHKYGVDITAKPLVTLGLTSLLLVVSLTTKTLQIYKDVKNGIFVNYDAEIQSRINVLTSNQEIIELSLIEAKPYSLFFYDMNTNPHGLWTECLGSYYGKDAVTFKEN